VAAVEAFTASDMVEQEYRQPSFSNDNTGEPLKIKKTREEPCQLTVAQEVAIVSWFQENKCLYDKSLREYRETEKRTQFTRTKRTSWALLVSLKLHITIYCL